MAKSARSVPFHAVGLKAENLIGTAGFVRLGRNEKGTWWLVDGQDRPFFSRGVTALHRSGRFGGRTSQPGPYELAVERRYGGPESPRFIEAALERLRSWHCNTVGIGSAREFAGSGMFFLETIGFRHVAPESTIKLGGALLPDVFDPRWVEGCATLAAERCAPLRENRELIGYCTDHGLQWAQPPDPKFPASRPTRPSLLQICLSLEPSFPAYHAAWEFVLAPHAGELTALARAWEIEPNKEAVRQLTLADTPLIHAAYQADLDRFTREFAHRYFQTCAAAIRQADPHHLVVGGPFATPPSAAVLAAGLKPAVDLLALGTDQLEIFETIEQCIPVGGLPVLLTEFSWTSEPFRTAKLDARRLTTVERMLANGRAALTRACSHPALVGYAWARWADAADDEPPFGRGLVHLDDREAREHAELFAELNARAESLHRSAAHATPTSSS